MSNFELSRDFSEQKKILSILYLSMYDSQNHLDWALKLGRLRGIIPPFLLERQAKFVNMLEGQLRAAFVSVDDCLSCAIDLWVTLEAAGVETQIGVSRGLTTIKYNPTICALDLEGEAVNFALVAASKVKAKAQKIIVSNSVWRIANKSQFNFKKAHVRPSPLLNNQVCHYLKISTKEPALLSRIARPS